MRKAVARYAAYRRRLACFEMRLGQARRRARYARAAVRSLHHVQQ